MTDDARIKALEERVEFLESLVPRFYERFENTNKIVGETLDTLLKLIKVVEQVHDEIPYVRPESSEVEANSGERKQAEG